MKVAGVDPSTVRTGIALPSGLTLSVRGYSLPKGSTVDERTDRVVSIVSSVCSILAKDRPDVVVLEGYGYALKGQAFALFELGGTLRANLRAMRVSLLEVPPSSLKKHATGNGRAEKPELLDRARELGGSPANHDEADAYLLRQYGLDLRAAIGARQSRTDPTTPKELRP